MKRADAQNSRQSKRKRSEGTSNGTAKTGEAGNGTSKAAANGKGDGQKAAIYEWKKLAKEVLRAREPDHRMRLQKLQLRVLGAAGLQASDLQQHGNTMVKRWAKSRKLAIKDGYVILTSPAP
jgi:hypothetical protein